jgi:uncharacterized membrane protein YfcA
MSELLSLFTENYLISFFLVLLGTITYTISTVGAGGGALMTIPGVSAIVGTQAVAPIVNLGAFLGRPSRFWLFRKTIDWRIVLYYLPASALGTFIAAYFFKQSPIVWIQIIIGLFLISTLFQYRYGKNRSTFTMKRIYFIPLGFFVSLVGTFTGGMGPIQNPFYLNLKIHKELMIGTKTANSFFMGLFQLINYSAWGLLSTEIVLYGISLGIGATIGNIIGKRIVVEISEQLFLKFVLTIMVASGLFLVVKGLISFV